MRQKLAMIGNQLFNEFINNKNEKLKKFFNNKVDKTEELLLKKYLQKWKEKNDILTIKENDSAIFI